MRNVDEPLAAALRIVFPELIAENSKELKSRTLKTDLVSKENTIFGRPAARLAPMCFASRPWVGQKKTRRLRDLHHCSGERSIRHFEKSRSIHGGLIVDQEIAMNTVADAHRARPRTTFDVESLFSNDFAPVQQGRCAEKSMSHYLSHVLCKRDMEKSGVCICKLLSTYWHD